MAGSVQPVRAWRCRRTNLVYRHNLFKHIGKVSTINKAHGTGRGIAEQQLPSELGAVVGTQRSPILLCLACDCSAL